MKTEKVFYTGEYKRHAIGFSILAVILGFPVVLILVQVGIQMSEKKELMLYLLSISPFPIIAYLGLRRLLEKREVKVSESGILYGRTMRPWSDIKTIKPLKLIGKNERMYHLMGIYKGITSTAFKIPLQTALTSEEYNSLADELEEHLQPIYPKLKIER